MIIARKQIGRLGLVEGFCASVSKIGGAVGIGDREKHFEDKSPKNERVECIL